MTAGQHFRANSRQRLPFDCSIDALRKQVVLSQTPGGIRNAALIKPTEGDLVLMGLSFKFGSVQALQNQGGAGKLAGAMLQRGTAAFTRHQLQEKLRRLGCVVSMGLNATGGTVMVAVRQANYITAIELVAHMLRESSFPEVEFEALHSASIHSVNKLIKDQNAQAQNAWIRYGNPYPPGDPRYSSTLEETLHELNTVSRNDAFAFYRQFYGAQNAKVALLGPVDVQQYQQALARAFDGWRAPQSWHRIERPLFDLPASRLVFDIPGRTSVTMRASLNVALSSKGVDIDFLALRVGARIFCHGPVASEWVRLQQAGLNPGLAAGVHASPHERSGSIFLSTEVLPHKADVAEKALHIALARSLDEGFVSEEVAIGKHQTLADRARGRIGDGWAMSYMSYALEFDEAPSAITYRDALIASLTPQTVNSVWRKYMEPAKLVWGIFGDLSKIR
jgi:zinc protease